MDVVKNNSKRKKRRTRKYLNEIRKRSQSYGDHCLAKNDSYGSNNVKKPNNNITKNRLTLSMFPKVVRSETITRPTLAEIKHKHNLNDIVKDKITSTVFNTMANDKIQININEKHSTSEIEEVNHDDESKEENESSPGEFVLNSPNLQDKKMYLSASNEISSDLINPLSPIPREYTSELNKSFMKELPHLLNSYSEELPKYNTNKTLRSQLDISTYSLKSPLTTVISIKSDKSTINRAMQNPIDYIRSTQKTSDDITELHNSSSGSSESQLYVNFPLLINSSSIIQETPEYNYYPHKLHH